MYNIENIISKRKFFNIYKRKKIKDTPPKKEVDEKIEDFLIIMKIFLFPS